LNFVICLVLTGAISKRLRQAREKGSLSYAAYLTDPDGWQLKAVFKTTLLERD
jgi:hypothetical protein